MIKIKFPQFLQCLEHCETIDHYIAIEALTYGNAISSKLSTYITPEEIIKQGSDLQSGRCPKRLASSDLAERVFKHIVPYTNSIKNKKKKTLQEHMIDNYIITSCDNKAILLKESKNIKLKLLLKQISLKNITIENDLIINIKEI